MHSLLLSPLWLFLTSSQTPKLLRARMRVRLQQPAQRPSSSSSSTFRRSIPEHAEAWIQQKLDPFHLKLHGFPDTGRGLQTTVDRSAASDDKSASNNLLLSVPYDDVWTSLRFLQTYPELFEQARGLVSSSQNDAAPLNDEQVLAWGLCKLKQQQQTSVMPQDDGLVYVQTLPTFQPSIYNMPQALRECLPKCYQRSAEISISYATALHRSLMDILDLGKAQDDDDNRISLDDFLWAISLVRSRSISAPELDALHPKTMVEMASGSVPRMMVPLLDMLNHDVQKGRCRLILVQHADSSGKGGFGAKSKAAKDNKKSNKGRKKGFGKSSPPSQSKRVESTDRLHWHLYADETVSYKADDQVFLSYGEDRDNVKLLFAYGFCTHDNPQRVALFDIPDLLQACQEARPNVFLPQYTATLQQQLDPTQADSEDRPVLSYHGAHKPLRQSMVQALDAMVNIAKQLGADVATASAAKQLRDDILQAMLRNRKAEVQACLDRINHDDDDQWHGFRSSIKVLLDVEASIL